ncbi:hypothetical protein N0V94_000755 [Neodidymelliopsis sp. IMI 364377]|nr:hypothetical protein N0V94_000755 [Neodidymelliopsis sp. IMI 364377]
MSVRFLTTILLAAGLAASKPISKPNTLSALAIRQGEPAKVDTSPNQRYDMAAALAALEAKAQQEVIQIKVDNLIIIDANIDNGDDGKGDRKDEESAEVARKDEEAAATQQLMLQQANQALAVEQQANAQQNEMDNVFRMTALAQKEPDKSTVLLVVQEIRITIEVDVNVDDEKKEKRKVEAAMYKQEAIVANRGKRQTETVMIYSPRTLTAIDIAATDEAEATPTDSTNATAPATKTIDAVLYNAKPTHTAIMEDPAAGMRAIWEAALEDRQSAEDRKKDVELNVEIAVEIKVQIEDDGKKGGERGGRKDDKNNKDGEDDGGKDRKDGAEDREREEKQRQDEEERQRKEEKKKEEKKKEEKKKEEKKKEEEAEKQQAEKQQANKEQEKKKEEKEEEEEKGEKEKEKKTDQEENGIKVALVQ